MSAGGRHRLSIPHASTARGTCRWCGLPILRPDGRPDRRRTWHPACVETYKLSWPGHARLRVKERDGGICAACGRDMVTRRLRRSRPITPRPGDTRHAGPYCRAVWTERHAWELDHIVPLADGGGHELGNMQTLCRPCHRAKTTREAAERARRRLVAAQGGTPQPTAHRSGRTDQLGCLVEPAPRTG